MGRAIWLSIAAGLLVGTCVFCACERTSTRWRREQIEQYGLVPEGRFVKSGVVDPVDGLWMSGVTFRDTTTGREYLIVYFDGYRAGITLLAE